VSERVVEMLGVNKDYPSGLLGRGRVPAVHCVSFHVEAGEVFGLVGPNRAGKTTLVKILLSLCRASAGRVVRLGRPVHDRSTLARVGYVHECQAFPRYLSATALLEYYGALSLLPQPVVHQRVPPLLERVGLADRAEEAIGRFSKGMVQRLALAQALVNDPNLLVLDEPAEGLDLAGRQLVREVLAERREQGRSVLLVSHSLGDVEAICDRVGVLVAGRLVHLGAPSALTRDLTGGATRSFEEALRAIYEKGAA
jgi:ABC-2 type transport system ATP-binding protein